MIAEWNAVVESGRYRVDDGRWHASPSRSARAELPQHLRGSGSWASHFPSHSVVHSPSLNSHLANFPTDHFTTTTPSTMKLHKLKVRPKKETGAAPCAAEFATMLACWASSSDLASQGPCADSARALQECMRTKVSWPFKWALLGGRGV